MRGSRDQRSLKFYGSLNKIPPISPRPSAGNGPEYPVPGQTNVRGEFRGSARWLTSPYAADAFEKGIFPVRPARGAVQAEDPGDGGGELGVLLDAIAEEVHRHASAARDGVLADFAARAAYARKHLPRSLLAATLAAIKQQRKAAMALISRNASLEIAARRQGAIDAFGKNAFRRGKRGPPNNTDDPIPKP